MRNIEKQNNNSKPSNVIKMNNEQEQALFKVVINHEEQYSIWPLRKKMRQNGMMKEKAIPGKSACNI